MKIIDIATLSNYIVFFEEALIRKACPSRPWRLACVVRTCQIVLKIAPHFEIIDSASSVTSISKWFIVIYANLI